MRLYTREDGIVWTNYYKIADDRTIHSHTWDVDSSKQFGINIDIFPLDVVKKPWKRRFITLIGKLMGYKLYDAADRPILKRLVAYFVKGLLLFVSKESASEFIENYLIEYDGNLMTNIYGAYGDRENMPKSYFGKPELMDFEDTKLYGVAKPHEYLTTMYGEYMQLPPEDKRHLHIIDMYWK